MSKSISSLWVGLGGDISGLSSAFKSAITPVNGLLGGLHKASGGLTGVGVSMLKLTGIGAAFAVGMGAVRNVFGGLTDSISLSAQLEQNQIAFETMLGSADKAKSLLSDLATFAKETPFNLPGTVTAAKQLLAFGIESKNILPTLRMVGDVSSGIGAPIGDIAYLFGTIKTQGRAMTRDILQFANRGIPIYESLAQVLHTDTAGVQQMVTAGKVGFPEIQAAFKSMTGEGGKFGGLMEKQSHSLGGIWAGLTDNVSMGLAGVVTKIIDAFNLKAGLSALSNGMGSMFGLINSWVGRIAPVVKSIGLTVYGTFAGIYSTVAPIVGRVFTFVSSVFTQLVPIVIAAGQSIWSAVSTAFQAVYGVVSSIAQSIYQVIATNWQANLQSTVLYFTSIWDFVQSAFGFILDIAKEMWGGVTAVWNWGAGLIVGQTNDAGNSTISIFDAMSKAGRWLQDTLSTAFGVMGFALTHWKDVGALAITNVELAVVRFANQNVYYFGTVIPSILKWFGDNWRDILFDVANFSTTVFKNLASNIVSIVANIPGLISGKVSFSDLWTPLTDGFRVTLKELPKIAERQIGGTEAVLAASSEQLSKQLTSGLGEYLAGQQQQAVKTARNITDGLTKALTPPKRIDAPKIDTPEAPKIPPAELDAKVNPSNLDLKITPKVDQDNKLIYAGSAEAQMIAAGFGAKAAGVGQTTLSPNGLAQPSPAAQPAVSRGMKDAVQDLTKRMVDELVRQTKLLTSINDKTAQDSGGSAVTVVQI